MSITYRYAETKQDYAWCVYVRSIVFVIGQDCPPELDFDKLEDSCRHILAINENMPCATARWRVYKPNVAKIERVAVLDTYRGKGIGHALIQAVIDDIKISMHDCKTLRLEAQDYAIPFYEKLGFHVVGDGFMDVGIPHHAMEKAT